MSRIDRFAFDERTPFQERMVAFDGYMPRPLPVALDLFSQDAALARIGTYDQLHLIRALHPMVFDRPQPIERGVRTWADKLEAQTNPSLWADPTIHARLERGYYHAESFSDPDAQEVVDLHSYANELGKLRDTIAEQTHQTNLRILPDHIIELVESPEDETVFIPQKQVDEFARHGVHAPVGEVPKEALINAYIKYRRLYGAFGKVALTWQVETSVANTYTSFSKLLDYYNENRLLVPKRSGEYLDSMLWGLTETRDYEPKPLTAEAEVLVGAVKRAKEWQKSYSESHQGEADEARRDMTFGFGRIFGRKAHLVRMARLLHGASFSYEIERKTS